MDFRKKTTAIAIFFALAMAAAVGDSHGSTPTVTIPGNIEASPGQKVLVPVNVGGVQGAGIGGFVIRLCYDETVLSNPKAISEGTLTDSNSDLVHGPARDDQAWDFSVGLGFDFSPSEDGVLFRVEFDVSPDAESGTVPVRFVLPNEETYLNVDLMSTGFDLKIVPALFEDGSVAVSAGNSADTFDFELFRKHWLTRCDSPDWDASFDFVPDCVIDYQDLRYAGDRFFEPDGTSSKSRETTTVPVVSIPQDMELTPGGSVDVPVNISACAGCGIAGYSLRLVYDENVFLNPRVVAEGTQSETYGQDIKLIVGPSDGIGKCAVSIYRFEPDESDILVKLRFDIPAEYSGEGAYISFAMPNLKTVLFESDFDHVEARFTPATGDIDNDGDVTLSDTESALKVLVGSAPGVVELASDVNGDRVIDALDALYGMKHAAGLLLK